MNTRTSFLFRALGSGGIAFIPLWAYMAAQPFILVYARYQEFVLTSSLVIFIISSLLILRGATNRGARFLLLFSITASLFVTAGNYGHWFGENSRREPLIFLICAIAFLDALRRESGERDSARAHRLFRISEGVLVVSIPLIFLLLGVFTLPVGLLLLWVALVLWSVEQWSAFKKLKEYTTEESLAL